MLLRKCIWAHAAAPLSESRASVPGSPNVSAGSCPPEVGPPTADSSGSTDLRAHRGVPNISGMPRVPKLTTAKQHSVQLKNFFLETEGDLILEQVTKGRPLESLRMYLSPGGRQERTWGPSRLNCTGQKIQLLLLAHLSFFLTQRHLVSSSLSPQLYCNRLTHHAIQWLLVIVTERCDHHQSTLEHFHRLKKKPCTFW